MKFLQVRNSLFTNESIKNIVNSYNIGRIKRCEFLSRGLNDTYKVITEKNEYVFRLYRKGWREKSDILYEIDAINHLGENGAAISIPFKRTDGEWLSEINAPEGIRYGVLFNFSKGNRPEITQNNCYLIGQSLGRIHKVSNSFLTNHIRHFELTREHLLDEPMSFITPVIQPFNGDFLNQVASQLKRELLDNQTLEHGFCHGDFHNFNMHLSEHNLEVFDFDCCGYGYRAYDIAVFLWNLKNNYPSLEEPCWDSFVNGYLNQYSLSEGNLKEVLKFVTLRRIWLLGTVLKNDDVWGTTWIHKNTFDHFISQIEQDVENY